MDAREYAILICYRCRLYSNHTVVIESPLLVTLVAFGVPLLRMVDVPVTQHPAHGG